MNPQSSSIGAEALERSSQTGKGEIPKVLTPPPPLLSPHSGRARFVLVAKRQRRVRACLRRGTRLRESPARDSPGLQSLPQQAPSEAPPRSGGRHPVPPARYALP